MISAEKENLVEIKQIIPDAILDIKYATEKNFTGQIIYDEPYALLLPEPLEALRKAAEIFRNKDLYIVVFDAWRPQWAQAKLREACSDDKYVSNTPRHSSGRIIDMTLADGAGRYLEMGTYYDDFTPKAHSDSTDITESQSSNRRLLKEEMAEQDFKQYPYEWWDFEHLSQI